ncbi:RagB/SusD family nutrient uptake outer membrane protein [Sinomicrobium pectinilyticum]|uniref:RagB/SusD family nutrient uptake outer membrane protein n=1 Tax=Sinomicrobium pectinilyticum TaxID=1084421 RepID=A0A3N0EN05_SINP1|nr:RagB/SusD family nutrient uptake outer membrane protein [Sinomicrobium pectinilyticum]RNL89152.1 RagB/SusD family nutrient uptake outer membrane protein [Sinomicrobium pectinilyticum]
MKTNHIKYTVYLVMIGVASVLCSCQKDFLKEEPIGIPNSGNLLVDKEGFESAVTGLHIAARELFFYPDGSRMNSFWLGTDVACTGDRGLADFENYQTWLTPAQWSVEFYWNWAYLDLIPRANNILAYIDNPDIFWESEEEKNAIIAEARFFRGYAYNMLANLYGGVPIVDRISDSPRTDFVRSTRREVYEFVREDLEYASQWLPAEAPEDGRIERGAANHLLTEVYISLEDYEAAVASATAVIGSPRYRLMTERFGNYTDRPGDVFADLFKDENQNRSTTVNTETIWALQFEFQTAGGTAGGQKWYANGWLRAWGPKWWDIRDPDGNTGMELTTDSLGRGVAWVRPTSYFYNDIWKEDPSDMRNSGYNIKRKYYYNNPDSPYFGQEVDPMAIQADTMVNYYPMIMKIEPQLFPEGESFGRAFKDTYVMRLAETYLLRAEAYWRMGNSEMAAADINELRNRAHATEVEPAEVDLDYILDERARELIIEEPRRLTLNRVGKLAERVRRYNPESGSSVQDYHNLFPIPLSAIDANIDARLEQNPGY